MGNSKESIAEDIANEDNYKMLSYFSDNDKEYLYECMQEYADQQTKQLTDEIEQQKMQCSVYHNDILNLEGEKVGLLDEIEQLKFELQAADSVNEQMQFQYNELEKAMYKLTISNDNN